jgi:hypothetical protein
MIFYNFSETEKELQVFLHRGLFDPGPLTRGPEGPLARPRWTRSTWPAAGRGLLGTEAWEPAGSLRRRWWHEGGEEKAQPDQKLTGESPARSSGPEEGRRWRISAVARSGPAGKRWRAAAISSTPGQFLRRGDCGRCGGGPRQVDGARGGF